MINAITQETLHLILPGKVSQMALLYAKKVGVSAVEALKKIYMSQTYKDLEREETKLWHLGPVGLLEHLEEHQ